MPLRIVTSLVSLLRLGAFQWLSGLKGEGKSEKLFRSVLHNNLFAAFVYFQRFLLWSRTEFFALTLWFKANLVKPSAIRWRINEDAENNWETRPTASLNFVFLIVSWEFPRKISRLLFHRAEERGRAIAEMKFSAIKMMLNGCFFRLDFNRKSTQGCLERWSKAVDEYHSQFVMPKTQDA